jgi:hypothetical protein
MDSINYGSFLLLWMAACWLLVVAQSGRGSGQERGSRELVCMSVAWMGRLACRFSSRSGATLVGARHG